MEIFFLYAILKLDAILALLSILFFVCAAVTVIASIAYYVSDECKKPNPEWATWYELDWSDRDKKIEPSHFIHVSVWQRVEFKRLVIVMLVLLSVNTIIPSTKQAAILAGGYYTVEVIKSEEGKKILQILRKQANEYLDKELVKK